jgi:manganese efflux pump family protein
MELAASFLIAVGLAMDAFAVSLGVGTSGQARDFRSRFRLAFHFGIFQALMTLLGWLLGSTIANFINSFDHWVAMGLLGYVGVNMIRSGLNKDSDRICADPSRGRTLIMLCVATSLDALAVGLSMAMIHAPVVMPSAVIGLVCLTLSGIGLLAGTRLGEAFGKKMEVLGGIILIGIGIEIVVSHLNLL